MKKYFDELHSVYKLSPKEADAIFKMGEENGFKVINVEEFRNSVDGYKYDGTKMVPQSEKTYPYTEMWVETPFFYKGQPVRGFMGLGPSDIDNHPSLNAYVRPQMREFYIGDGSKNKYDKFGHRLNYYGDYNLEDVVAKQCKQTGENYKDAYKLEDKDGNTYTYEEATSYLTEFCTAANHYPHVCTKEEYFRCMEDNYRKMKIDDKPSEAKYAEYLESQADMIESGDIRYVGQITSARDFDEMFSRSGEYTTMKYSFEPEEYSDAYFKIMKGDWNLEGTKYWEDMTRETPVGDFTAMLQRYKRSRERVQTAEIIKMDEYYSQMEDESDFQQ